MAKALTKQHSSYWLGDSVDVMDLSRKGDTVAEALKLITMKRSVANFVRIVTGESYPVEFSSGQRSFTDGKTVVLSASASDKNFDSLVGVSLHEASHLLLSDFEAVKAAQQYFTTILPIDIAKAYRAQFGKRAIGYGGTTNYEPLKQLFHTLFNIFEDRRIDYFIYRNAPGYRPYYEAMYDRYFRSAAIDTAMREFRVRIPTVENYVFWLINMANPLFDTRALPGLDKVYGLIDLNTINRLDVDPAFKTIVPKIAAAYKVTDGHVDESDMPVMWQMIFNVIREIFAHADDWDFRSEDTPEDPPGRGRPCEDGEPGDDDGGESEGGSSGSNPESGEGDNESDSDGEGESAESDEEDGESDGSGEGSGSDEEDDESDGSGSGEGARERNWDDVLTGESGSGGSGDGEEESGGESGASGEDESENEGRERTRDEDTKRGNRKFNEKSFERDLANQKKFLQGDVRKTKITKDLQGMTKALDSAGAEMVRVDFNEPGRAGGSAEVVVLRKLDRAMLDAGSSPFTSNGKYGWGSGGYGRRRRRYYYDSYYAKAAPQKQPGGELAVEAGFRMGRILASKLAIRNQSTTRKYNRRPDGKIDKRRLASIGAGDSSVFYHVRKTAYEPVFLHMSIDASGSMNGTKFNNALALSIAVAVAADTIENLEVEISLRGTGGRYAVIQTVYDSRVDSPIKIRTLFPYLTSGGTTPEGLCFDAISKEILKSAAGKDAYFVNLSDGEPVYDNYYGRAAWKHTKAQVMKFRGAGIRVLSYYIGFATDRPEDQVGFKTMYGKSAVFIDPTQITAIAKTLNKMFLA